MITFVNPRLCRPPPPFPLFGATGTQGQLSQEQFNEAVAVIRQSVPDQVWRCPLARRFWFGVSRCDCLPGGWTARRMILTPSDAFSISLDDKNLVAIPCISRLRPSPDPRPPRIFFFFVSGDRTRVLMIRSLKATGSARSTRPPSHKRAPYAHPVFNWGVLGGVGGLRLGPRCVGCAFP